jgi:hypothetical protein
MTVRARHVLCLLHDAATLEPIVARYPGFTIDREFSIDESDARMHRAFEASMDRVAPSITDEDWAAIDAHRAVTYVLSPPIDPPRALEISTAALQLIRDALEAGAAGAKGESAGIAHGAARWKQLAEDLRESPPEMALHGAWVRRPIADDDTLYTCGMHLLGLPDVELPDEADAHAAVSWLDAFAGYQLVEAAQAALADGHTFRPDEDSTRRVLRKVECTRYAEDEFFYNPHGYWRIEAAPDAEETTEEPAAETPAAKQPATNKPAANKPAANKPAADKPAAKKSATTKAAKKPAAKKPATTTPATKKPAAKKPAPEKPAATKPAAKKPAAKNAPAKMPAAKKPAAKNAPAKKPASKTSSSKKPGAKPAKKSAVKPAKQKPRSR